MIRKALASLSIVALLAACSGAVDPLAEPGAAPAEPAASAGVRPDISCTLGNCGHTGGNGVVTCGGGTCVCSTEYECQLQIKAGNCSGPVYCEDPTTRTTCMC
jgi:hypothetical protein